jgi:hypothetical protein
MSTKNRLWLCLFIIIGFALCITSSCKRDKEINDDVFGYGFLSKIPGLWHGPVTSTTNAGSFDNWYADFRPVSGAQVSQFSLLDTNTVNNISFFIVKYNGQLKVAMRTEGCFKDQCCVTYEVMDSVSESAGYYRFSDFVKGTKRAYTEFNFGDSTFTMKVYTNKFNTVNPVQQHTIWTARLGSRSNAAAATTHFNYPQAVMIKDFSSAFTNMSESIFFTFENDPYQSVTQPYVGSATVNITIDTALTTDLSDKIFLMLTTEPLFEGLIYKEENLKYTSKYVFLSSATTTYQINNVHPGKYYIYSFIDRDHDNKYLSGDYMSSDLAHSFNVLENADANVSTIIDYIIP